MQLIQFNLKLQAKHATDKQTRNEVKKHWLTANS